MLSSLVDSSGPPRHDLIVDAITDNARRTVADGYGEFPIDAMCRELGKIPDVIASHETRAVAET
jgi:hypothetical protein